MGDWWVHVDWSDATGKVAFFLAGLSTRPLLERLWRKIRGERKEPTMSQPEHPMRRKSDRKWWRRLRAWVNQKIGMPRWIAAVFMVAMMIVLGLQSWQAGENQICAQRLGENIVASRELSRADRLLFHRATVQEQEFFRSVIANRGDEEANMAAFREWTASFDAYRDSFNKTTQQLKKLPVDPDEICD